METGSPGVRGESEQLMVRTCEVSFLLLLRKNRVVGIDKINPLNPRHPMHF